MGPGGVAIAERAAAAASRLGFAPRPFPAPMFDAYLAPMAARVVMAATSTGVVDALHAQPDTAAGVATRLGLDEQAVDLLLGALVTMSYVRRGRDGRFRLARRTKRWLVGSSRVSLATWVGAFSYHSWDHMTHLENALRGAPPIGLHDKPADDPYWDAYQGGLAETAEICADITARAIPVKRPERLLDLAGGHGRYAEALCRRHAGLHATVVELPGPVRLGRQRIERVGLSQRIDYMEADLLDPEFELPPGADLATAHSILHCLSPDQCVELLTKAREALRGGGAMAVLELERPRAGKAGSQLAALGGVLFHILDGTRTYKADELAAFMHEAGFEKVRAKRPLRLPGLVLMLARC